MSRDTCQHRQGIAERHRKALTVSVSLGGQQGPQVVLRRDGHARDVVPFQPGDVDHVVGCGDAGGEVERHVTLAQDEKSSVVFGMPRVAYENGYITRQVALDDMAKTISDLARQCWPLFKLRGWARVDFRVDAAGEPWILEINGNPCLSPDAGFAAAMQQASIPYDQGIQRILEDARA